MKPCRDHGYKGNRSGYAEVRHQGKKVKLHRLVFFKQHGHYPPVVMHRCDNPRCIEVTHLEAGDWDRNNKDRAAKGRSAKRLVAKRRLTGEQAEEIRSRFAMRGRKDPVNGPVALGREFGVDPNVIYQIASGRTYR